MILAMREGFAGAGYTQQNLVLFAIGDASGHLFNGVYLVPARLITDT